VSKWGIAVTSAGGAPGGARHSQQGACAPADPSTSWRRRLSSSAAQHSTVGYGDSRDAGVHLHVGVGARAERVAERMAGSGSGGGPRGGVRPASHQWPCDAAQHSVTGASGLSQSHAGRATAKLIRERCERRCRRDRGAEEALLWGVCQERAVSSAFEARLPYSLTARSLHPRGSRAYRHVTSRSDFRHLRPGTGVEGSGGTRTERTSGRSAGRRCRERCGCWGGWGGGRWGVGCGSRWGPCGACARA